MLMTGRTLFHVNDDLEGQATWPEAFAGGLYDVPHRQVAQPGRFGPALFQRGKAIFFGGMGDPYALPLQDISPEHTLVNQPEERRAFGEAVRRRRGRSSSRVSRGKAVPLLCPLQPAARPARGPAGYHDRYNADRCRSPRTTSRNIRSTTAP